MVKFQIRLDENAFRFLRMLAELEYRDPRYQAALLIRESLERRGLLAQAIPTPILPDDHNKVFDHDSTN